MRKKIIILLALGMLFCTLFNINTTNNHLASNTQPLVQFWIKRTSSTDNVSYYVGSCKDTKTASCRLQIHQRGSLHNSTDDMPNLSTDFTKVLVPKDDYIVFESKLWPYDEEVHRPICYPVDYTTVGPLFSQYKNYAVTTPQSYDFMLGNGIMNYTPETFNVRYGGGFDKYTKKYYTYIQAEPWVASYTEWTDAKKTSLKVAYFDFYAFQAGASVYKNTLAYRVRNMDKS